MPLKIEDKETLTPEEEEDLKKIGKSAGGDKSAITQWVPQLEAACKDLAKYPTEEARQALVALMTKVEDKSEEILDKYQRCQFLDLTKNWKAWDLKIEESNVRLIGCRSLYKEATFQFSEAQRVQQEQAIKDQLKAAGPAGACPPSAQGGVGSFRYNEKLLPEKLTREWQPAEYREWKDAFSVFYDASQLQAQPLKLQHSLFKRALHKDLASRLETELDKTDNQIEGEDFIPLFKYQTTDDNPSVEEVLDDIYDEFWSIFVKRVDFFKYKQRQGQLFSDYVVESKKKALEADLAGLTTDELQAFLLIAGCCDEKLKLKFLRLQDPDLKEMERIWGAYELGNQALKQIKKEENKVNKAINKKAKKAAKKEQEKQGNAGSTPGQTMPSTPAGGKKKFNKQRLKQLKQAKVCFICGSTDHRRNCPVKQTVYCKLCEVKGHHTKVCLYGEGPFKNLPKADGGETDKNETKLVRQPTHNVVNALKSKPTPKVHLVLESLEGDSKGTAFSISCPDSGASRTVVSKKLLRKHNIKWRIDHSELLSTANGENIDCGACVMLGVRVQGENRDQMVHVDAVVSDDIEDEVLISWYDLQSLGILPIGFPQVLFPKRNLVRKISLDSAREEEIMVKTPVSTVVSSNTADVDGDVKALFSEFDDVLCDELSSKTLKGPDMIIKLRSDTKITPRRCLTARQVPVHYKDAADELINQLLEQGVISRVETPTEWVSPAHFVPKPNGKVRLVTDYQQLNRYVDRPVQPFPSALDMIRFVEPGSNWFCKMDALNGYFQVPLSEDSKLLTTFILPQGRFCYNRAPQGFIGSGDEFNIRTDAVIRDVKQADKLVDDILARGKTREELLNGPVRQVLENCRKYGMTLSKSKFQIGQELEFCGHIISKDGIKPSPERLLAIENFPSPTDLTSLRSFLGLANQLAHFLPDLSASLIEMRKLLEKGAAWQWLPEHENEFENAKKLLLASPILAPFDPACRTILLTDASKLHGLGYALMQEHSDGVLRLVQCGSNSLTKAQKRYAVIELEALAIVLGVKKFSYYLKGAKFEVMTDHQPLVGLFSKDITEIDNVRLAKYRELLSSFCFDVTWVKGKDNVIADALSRYPVFSGDSTFDEENTNLCRQVREDPSFNVLFEGIDDSYRSIIQALRDGKNPSDLPIMHAARELQHVWRYLSLYDDEPDTLILFDDSRVLVPRPAKEDILRLLHLAHAGIVKTRKNAQQKYFWVGMNKDIVDMIRRCDACQALLPSQQQEPLIVRSANCPMEETGSDLFFFEGNWLILVDRYSGFPFVERLRKVDTDAVTKILYKWMMDFGFTKVLYTDNGPQFRDRFNDWCKKYNIRHELSSAKYPQSNGLAEIAVKQVKYLIKKCQKLNQEFRLSLLEYRNTPRHDGFSPSELFFGRKQRTLLPSLPVSTDLSFAEMTKGIHREKVKARYDQHSKEMPPFKIGDNVILQDSDTREWVHPGVITDVREGGRSYYVLLENSSQPLLRNRRFLRPNYSLKNLDVVEVEAKSDNSVQDSSSVKSSFKKPVYEDGRPTSVRRSVRIAEKPKINYFERYLQQKKNVRQTNA